MRVVICQFVSEVFCWTVRRSFASLSSHALKTFPMYCGKLANSIKDLQYIFFGPALLCF